jgi:hypothetical protein
MPLLAIIGGVLQLLIFIPAFYVSDYYSYLTSDFSSMLGGIAAFISADSLAVVAHILLVLSFLLLFAVSFIP